jgi:cytochrome c peroxidase
MKVKAYFFASLLIYLAVVSMMACQREKEQNNKTASSPEETIREEVGALPVSYISPADNPASAEKTELGRLLFYDPILSGGKDVACASCHHPEYGYAESQELSIGVNGTGLGEMRRFTHPNAIPFARRNAHSLLNTAFNGIDVEGKYTPEKAPMFWDLRVESLEKQALEPVKNFEEMRGPAYEAEVTLDSIVNRLRHIQGYKGLFTNVFGGSSPITAENIGKALAAFERSLTANNSRFDRYMRGDHTALSSLEKEGLAAFTRSGCAKCHNGPMFSDFKLHVLGVADNKKLKATDAGPDSSYAFRTPTLRNLRYTDPYMHSGTLKTLRRVMEFYEDMASKAPENPHVSRAQLDPLVKKMRLKFKDFQAIEAFLNSLNDDQFDRRVPESVPSGLPVGGNIR